MDTVFIVRPFGNNRPVPKKNEQGKLDTVFFDFDTVEDVLIKPAIDALKLEGGTTQRIFEAGEIKEDMFSLLLTADIVIADITIHNANVFYELGIRHALRCKTTVLIKCAGFDESPFDIIGYKYISYQKDNPAAALPALIQFLIDSPESNKKDSPVFNMLPKLKEQEPDNFLAVPPGFADEVAIAAASKQLGKLLLLAREAEFFPWKIPALRFIGEELFRLKALDAGRIIWEKIKARKPDDIQANDRLATVYQRLAENEMKNNPAEGLSLLAKSDLAIQNLLENYANLDLNKRAEAYSLKGRNAKTKWLNSWRKSVAANKTTDALQSSFWDTAFKNYETGFYENLNHFYSGINALALLSIKISLADQLPDQWKLPFDTDEAADIELKRLKDKKQKLAVALEFSIAAEKQRLNTQGKSNIWLDITEADLAFLTILKPPKIAFMYKQVLQNAQDFEIESATNQLKIYEQLNVLPENVQASLNAIGPVQAASIEPKKHIFLFTGHMVDKDDRKQPRFPKTKEPAVRQKIKEQVQKEMDKINGPVIGMAGGACGGDILFHEICGELGIETTLYLSLPADQFEQASVAFAGLDWMERFNELYKKLPHCILCDTKFLPVWLQKKKDYTFWERNNLWELNSALVNGGMNMTLFALWDGKPGDGAGGTQHMVAEAKERGAKVVIIDMNQF